MDAPYTLQNMGRINSTVAGLLPKKKVRGFNAKKHQKIN